MTLMIGQGLSPAIAIEQAHADLVRIPVDDRRYVRYLSLYATKDAERAKLIQAISAHCNSLSRNIDIRPPTIVPDNAGSLLRVDLRNYEWNTEVWEKLVDPYFTTTIKEGATVQWEGGIWPGDGKNYPAGSFTYKRPKTTILAPWLAESPAAVKKVADVANWTYSKSPIVRGDWFVYQTIIQEGRAAGYYDFLGIKDQKGFEQVIRFDAVLASRLEHRRAMVFSGIALQPRRIERTNTALGGLWRTFDNEDAINEKNPLTILDDDFKFDATEQIAPLPNGMAAFFLGDNKGKKQDKAPDKIVGGDRTGKGNDTRLHICLSCIRCHFGMSKKENGVKEADFARITKLKSYDFQKYDDLQRQYKRDLDLDIFIDRAKYTAAIKKATGGMTPFDYAAELTKVYDRYDGPVTPERAAADLGILKEKMLGAFRAYDEKADLNPVLSILLDGRAIGIRQWEEVFATANATIRGYVP